MGPQPFTSETPSAILTKFSHNGHNGLSHGLPYMYKFIYKMGPYNCSETQPPFLTIETSSAPKNGPQVMLRDTRYLDQIFCKWPEWAELLFDKYILTYLGLLSTSSELNGPASAQRHAHHHS
jgi:hypothetical protein